MRQKTLLLTAAAFLAAAGNLFAQNWNMVISLSNGTKDTMAVKDVTDVTFFEATKPQDPAEAIGIKWIKVEPGTFEMGSPASEDGADPDETQHTVTLTKGYYISKYPITFEQYDKFCEATGREKPKDFNWGRGKRPVVDVTWNDAQAFCEWLGCRLLTEAEWEYAARGKEGKEFPWEIQDVKTGDGCFYANFKPDRGNYTKDGNLITSKVGVYSSNSNGLYDMAGNVAEWTSTVYTASGVDAMNDLNPQLTYNAAKEDPYRLKKKSVRGGSWKDPETFIRSVWRSWEYQNQPRSYIGFRCVRSLANTVSIKPKKGKK